MLIKMYDFAKRQNSTLQPPDSITSVEFECSLKHATSIYNPVFVISASGSAILPLNYCSAFDKYYFVTDVKSINANTWEVSCTLDYMATYKEQIGNTHAFIDYAETGYNVNVYDDRIQPSQVLKNDQQYGVKLPHMDLQTGNYILSVVNNLERASGAFTTSYCLSPTGMGKAAKYFMEKKDLFEKLIDHFNSPYDAIISCTWVPFDDLIYSEGKHEVILGDNISLDVVGKIVTSPTYNFSLNVGIPRAYTDFRACSPFSQYSIYLPSVGLVNLPSNELYGVWGLTIHGSYDLYTGDIVYIVSGFKDSAIQNPHIFGTYTGKTGADVPIGQVRSNGVLQVIGGGVATAAGAVTGNIVALGAGLGAAFNGVYSREISSSGRAEGRAGYYAKTEINVFCSSYETQTTSINDTLGRPVKNSDYIKNHSGYVKTARASVYCGSPIDIRTLINNTMDGGFYYE